MDKTIIILSGSVNEGKDKFNEIAKQNGFWTWCVNKYNPAKLSSEIMGNEDEIGSEEYYKNLKEYIDVCNKLWNFQPKYYLRMINKFYRHEKANVLLIHSLNDKDFIEELKEDEGVNTIHITDREPSNELLSNYDYVLNIQNSSFSEKVVNMLNVFTNKNKENE
jgi:hypothetical protein